MPTPKNITFITVENDFQIGGASTAEIVKKFKDFLDAGILNACDALLATINYVTSQNNIEDGPVRIYFTDGTRIKLNLTAGYGGTGPHHTCEILKLCGFEFDENDILSHQEEVNLKYYKDIDDTKIYQFINMDGTFEYSF